MHPHALKLQKAGYTITVHSEYHFSVQKPGSSIIVNVWPTARKILRKWEKGPAPHYTDIVEATTRIFEYQPHVIFIDDSMWDEDDPLVQEIYRYRRDPLQYLQEIINKR